MLTETWRWLGSLGFALACSDQPRSVNAPPATNAAAEAFVLDVDGVALKHNRVMYGNGLLSIYTGSDSPKDPANVLSFWGMPNVPSGQVVRYPGGDSGAHGARITYGDQAASTFQTLEGAHYEISIGAERDFRVSVHIDAAADKPVRLRAHGTLTAMTQGIKIVDGAVDRSVDDLDTIEYLTRVWIETHHAAKQFASSPDYCDMKFGARSPGGGATPTPTSACSYVYRDANGRVGVTKLQFEKRDGRWLEVGELAPNQLLLAHPLHPPAPDSPDALQPLAMLRFEREVYAAVGGFQRMGEPMVAPCDRVQPSHAWCEIRYEVLNEDRDLKEATQFGCQFATYLFERDATGAYRITRGLKTPQQYDPHSQKVVPRALPPECRSALPP